MAKKFSLESCELIAPVTALEFTKTELFIGEGAYISVYETTNGNRIAIQRVFQHQRVHCIRVFDVNDLTTVVVCGGKAASILHFQQSPSGSIISVVNTTLLCDWIWDICLLDGPLQEKSLHVALATGHNAVWLWNAGEDTKFKVAQCEEQCILYCARFIGHELEKLWLACGTVFNDVLLWKVANKMNDDGVCVHVSRRLKGHDGVIFSIAYDEERQILCSVSDDRSVKVWRLGTCCENSGNMQVETEPLLELYGHKARVWDCLITCDYIVTIGEDSTCLVWNSKGEIIKMFKGHIGKSIWSLAVDQSKQVISTGGGDGSVRLWSLSDDKENMQRQQHSFSTIPEKDTYQPNTEIPRSLAFLPNNNVLVMTDNGNFYSYNWSQDSKEKSQTECWDFYRNEPGFCSYSLMVLSPCCTIMALGNIHGNIKLLSTIDNLWCAYEMKPYDGKILSLHWIKYNESENALNLFSCGPDGCITWWTVSCLDTCTKKAFLCGVKAYFRLPYCRQRWPNSIFIQPKEMASLEVTNFEQDLNEPLVLCGDRRGSLHIFRANGKNDPADPLHSHINIHGRNGITHITSHGGFIYTAGRDGYFRQYKFCGTNLELVDERKVYKGLAWIARLDFNSDGDTLVLGFHTIDFVIWSMCRNEILLRIPCGGGHRIWDFHCTESDVERTIMFTYLKKLTVHVHKLSENKIPHSSILQESFHGREATCVCFVGSLQDKNKERSQLHVLATGSEDTNINIMAFNPKESQKKLRKIFTCQGHVSSVRCMTLAEVKYADEGTSTPYDVLLFSGGGRALLKCWSVNLTNITWNEQNCKTVRPCDKSLHPVCTLLAELPHNVSHYKKKKVQHEVMEGTVSDIRFMSVSVFWFPDLVLSKTWHHTYGIITGCSDGNLRMYLLDTRTKNFQLIGQCCWNDKCILCVGHIIHTSSVNRRLVVYAADTAGRITLWDFSDIFMEYISEFVQKSNEEQEMASKKHTRSDKKASTPVDVVPDKDNFKNSLSRPDIDSQSNKTITAFSAEPFFIYNLHQSGINAVSLVRQDSGQYLVCTGGDDGALVFAVFNLQDKHNILTIHNWDMVAVHEAHTSSITGSVL